MLSSFISSSRGVAICFKNTFEFEIVNEINDPTGNFIIIDAKLQGNRVTLVAVYDPNRDDPTFNQSLQSKIEMIGNTSVIIGGDWNVPLNYEIDTENYVNKNNPKAQQKIHALMAELDLVDV